MNILVLSCILYFIVLGHAEVVKCLLAFNSEPRWKNKQGVNALAGIVGGTYLDML